MLAISSLRVAARGVVSQRAAFSTSFLVRSEGSPTGAGQNTFNKRERAEEERYLRDSELEKLKALRKSIEASKKHLEQLEKDATELEKSSASKTPSS